MNIEFKTILPHPLRDIQHQPESIWGASFTLVPGEKILLNASSGKGKSTFTNITLGLRDDYDGTILFDGKDIRTLSLDEWVKIRQSGISVIFQDLQLFPDYSVKENLLLKSKLGSPFGVDEIKGFLTELGIGEKWDQKCGTLSLGQQQRVAIVRALLQPFEWLIMDEPFSHLDEENTQIALQLINRITDMNKGGYVLTSLGEKFGFQFDRELKL